ncbi:hypothetical protein J7I94_21445 [Streptomyces sp. ISL-12]|uniref:hypothetical protein n=1 Tax=Streptomyces sp. ISL-12 TaxID=2819177 RepID=UPI001BEBFFEA|nr:hypothetical protein [Streptomyces sp. ISL-12]MBT2413093.1 hypothetical protein [Streptomyces sp. ISL-12]
MRLAVGPADTYRSILLGVARAFSLTGPNKAAERNRLGRNVRTQYCRGSNEQ